MRNGTKAATATILARPIGMLVALVSVAATLLWVLSASAGAGTQVSTGSATVYSAGSQAASALTVTGVADLGAWTIDVSYDPAVADAVSVTCGSYFCNANFDNDGVNPDKVRCGGFEVQGLDGNAMLCSITFQAVAGPDACTNLALNISDFTSATSPYPAIPHTTSAGAFCLATPTPTPSPAPATPTLSPTPTPPPATPTPTPTEAPATPTPTVTPTPTPTPTPVVVTPTPVLTPTPTATPTATPEPETPTPTALEETSTPAPTAGNQYLWGDLDCDGDVDSVDALMLLRNIASLDDTRPATCPDFGQTIQ